MACRSVFVQTCHPFPCKTWRFLMKSHTKFQAHLHPSSQAIKCGLLNLGTIYIGNLSLHCTTPNAGSLLKFINRFRICMLCFCKLVGGDLIPTLQLKHDALCVSLVNRHRQEHTWRPTSHPKYAMVSLVSGPSMSYILESSCKPGPIDSRLKRALLVYTFISNLGNTGTSYSK